MSLPPPAIRADIADPAGLAAAALGCPALVRARKLAEWVGPGRELTSTGVLRPAVAAEACRALGIKMPGTRLRSALDVDELMRDWTVAVDAGMVIADGRRAEAAPGLAAAGEPRLVLGWWTRAAARGFGVPDEPCAGCLTVLLELSEADEPLGLEELALAVQAVTQPDAEAEPCPECGNIHDPAYLFDDDDSSFDDDDVFEDGEEHAEATVAGLAAFGAVTAADSVVRLTPLGRELAAAVFEGCAPPGNCGAATLMSVISEVPPAVARTMARPWLAARSAPDAARELLAFAESAGGEKRVAALAFARETGPGAAQAWREWAARPGFGAYARKWLAEQGESAAEDPADEAWLTVDALSIMLDGLEDLLPPFLLAGLFQQHLGGEGAAEASSLLRDSGHPAAAGIVASLTGQPEPAPWPAARSARQAPRAKRSGRSSARTVGTSVYQLKISLRGVSKPPVWRRVLVPADLTLDLLHEVILLAMGWDGGHLHVFEAGGRDYGTPDAELGHADECLARLDEVLAKSGDKMRYTYDFGDDWEHDIVLEEVAEALPGNGYPACVAGRGGCPPEDCGGVWGYAELKEILSDASHEQHQDMLDWLSLDSGDQFDPGAFSVDAVNVRFGREPVADGE